ncbi:MAG: SHOCT domain-containing protein [Candidatus Ryanbacteria bacterium]|nr:SHOCT domain-containing protein [Candidatus Ryanbacteria bacterium]
MTGNQATVADDHTQKEETEGKEIWQKLQAKERACSDLKDDDFGALGEYFMGTMMGSSHAAMNAMMTQMMGEEGEEQMHVVMGKRLSGCDTNAAFPANGTGFMPMMNMLTGSRSGMWGSFYPGQMNFSYGIFSLGLLGLLLWFGWWIIVIAVIVWFVRRLLGLTHKRDSSALEILKERYAKGEINKEEFETRKKDIV